MLGHYQIWSWNHCWLEWISSQKIRFSRTQEVRTFWKESWGQPEKELHETSSTWDTDTLLRSTPPKEVIEFYLTKRDLGCKFNHVSLILLHWIANRGTIETKFVQNNDSMLLQSCHDGSQEFPANQIRGSISVLINVSWHANIAVTEGLWNILSAQEPYVNNKMPGDGKLNEFSGFFSVLSSEWKCITFHYFGTVRNCSHEPLSQRARLISRREQPGLYLKLACLTSIRCCSSQGVFQWDGSSN